MTYEQFRQRALEGPEADPSAILLAKRDNQYVGVTALWLRKDGTVGYTAMTGVRRDCRGQGVALALAALVPLDEGTRLHGNANAQRHGQPAHSAAE
jgi:hypothetical protein